MVTSVRLEQYFWRVLDEIAGRDSLTLPEMLSRLYRESIEAEHNLGNFASFLRVCAIRYLELQMTGDIPMQPDISIASLDADNILMNESQRHVVNGWSKLESRNSIF
jgi:predicted DNA-binding ribbon-helix-helix protein